MQWKRAGPVNHVLLAFLNQNVTLAEKRSSSSHHIQNKSVLNVVSIQLLLMFNKSSTVTPDWSNVRSMFHLLGKCNVGMPAYSQCWPNVCSVTLQSSVVITVEKEPYIICSIVYDKKYHQNICHFAKYKCTNVINCEFYQRHDDLKNKKYQEYTLPNMNI